MSDFLNFTDACDSWTNLGKARTEAKWHEFIIRSLLPGFLLFFSFSLGVFGAAPNGTPVLFGLGFSVGLVMICLFGAFLVTGDMGTIAASMFTKRCSILAGFRTWLYVYVMNIIGCLWAAAMLGYATKLFSGNYLTYLLNVGEKKSTLPYDQMFWRALGCNILVNMAVFFSNMNKSFVGRVVGIVIPITTFAAIGFEHSIANWIVLPLAKMYDTTRVSWSGMAANLGLVTLGNWVGGSLFVGGYVAYNLYTAGRVTGPATPKEEAVVEMAPANIDMAE